MDAIKVEWLSEAYETSYNLSGNGVFISISIALGGFFVRCDRFIEKEVCNDTKKSYFKFVDFSELSQVKVNILKEAVQEVYNVIKSAEGVNK